MTGRTEEEVEDGMYVVAAIVRSGRASPEQSLTIPFMLLCPCEIIVHTEKDRESRWVKERTEEGKM